jgi:hypothetical protein
MRGAFPVCRTTKGRQLVLAELKGEVEQWGRVWPAEELAAQVPLAVLEALEVAAEGLQGAFAAELSLGRGPRSRGL